MPEEISAIFISGFISVIFNMDFSAILFGENAFFPSYMKFPIIVMITTLGWICITFITPPEKRDIKEQRQEVQVGKNC